MINNDIISYLIFLEEKEEMRLFKNINFLSNFPFLSHLQFETIKSIYLYCEIKTFNFNKILYKEGDDPAFFYMIKTGSFLVPFFQIQ